MPVTGDIDFGRPLVEQGMTIFRSFERNGHYRLLPQGLAIATGENKRPDFLLELVRGQSPLLPPAPYGVIDFRVQPQYRIDDALVMLRKQQPKAMLEETAFVSGFLRLATLSDIVNAAPELFKPVPLVWNGLDGARFVLRLPLNQALLLKNALIAEALPLTAIAEMFISGVSPRVPITVRFDPAVLMGKVAALENSEQLPWQDLVQFFRRDVELLPLEIVGDKKNLDADEFAHALADRVAQRYGIFIPAPKNDGQACLRLQTLEKINKGSFEWDLSQPITVTRPLVLTFNPLDVARQLIRDNGQDSVIRDTTVPPLRIGTIHVTISANLPSERLGVLSLGVTISAPPRPPARPQAIIETVEFVAPKDSATALLRLSPAEKPHYTFKTFVVMEDGMKRHEGQELPHSGDYLGLQPAHFPLTFVPVEAASDLLEIANVGVVCTVSKNGSQFKQEFELTSDRSAVVVALLKEETAAALEIEARSKDGRGILQLHSLPAAPLRLALRSFPEYGPHQIEIECVFKNDLKLVAIDLLPEQSIDSPTAITTMHFTPAITKREWNWFAKSPFYPGYKYRLHETPERAATAWSPTQLPFEPLVIDPALLTGGAP